MLHPCKVTTPPQPSHGHYLRHWPQFHLLQRFNARKYTHLHTRAHAHTHTHTHINTCARVHTHTRTHARTHNHYYANETCILFCFSVHESVGLSVCMHACAIHFSQDGGGRGANEQLSVYASRSVDSLLSAAN